MKVLLTVPMSRPKDDVQPMNDNGLGYLAASCAKAGAEVVLQVWNVNMDMNSFRQKLLAIRPDIVGMKVFTMHFNWAYNTLRVVKETIPDAVTVIGGPHPSTSRPEDIFSEFGSVLDYAVAGDGEASTDSLIQKVKAAKGLPQTDALHDVPGLIYRYNSEIRSNKRSFNGDLDSLPGINWALQQPEWFRSAVDRKKNGNAGELYNKILISDSRGCPALCGHCMSFHINGSLPRKRSINKLREEIDELVHKYNVRYLDFTGNAFLSDVGYLEDLCHRLIEFNLPLRWNCTGAAYDRNLRNTKLLELMKKSGCDMIHFGIETGNPRVMKRLCKPLSLEEYAEVVRFTASAGIKPLGYFMFGFPDETPPEMEDTIKYAVSLPFDSITFQTCIPFPGTSSHKALLENHGLKRIDWSTYDFNNPKLLPCKASINQLHSKLFKAKVLRRSRLARGLYRMIYLCK